MQSYKYSILFEEFLPNIARGLKGQVATVVDPRYDALIQSHVSRSSDKEVVSVPLTLDTCLKTLTHDGVSGPLTLGTCQKTLTQAGIGVSYVVYVSENLEHRYHLIRLSFLTHTSGKRFQILVCYNAVLPINHFG
jgi:hypothetical protein